MLRRRATCLLALGAWASACGPRPSGDDPPARLVAIRQRTLVDPAGTTLVLEPSAGSGAVAAAGPGAVAFLDYELAQVVVLDSSGRIIAEFGRHGSGPGEIQNPRFLLRTRSGFGVFDDAKLALVRFSPSGTPQPDLPLQDFAGIPEGILTGLAQLDNDQWVFSTREKRQAAWSASASRVAYATTAEDRVVVWDALRGDSTVHVGPAQPLEATEAAALASSIGLTVELGRRGCALSRAEALRQRGMTDDIPVIGGVALSPGGTLWTQLAALPPDSVAVRIQAGDSVELVRSATFPDVFLSDTLFVAEEPDSAGNTLAGTWLVRQREPGDSR